MKKNFSHLPLLAMAVAASTYYAWVGAPPSRVIASGQSEPREQVSTAASSGYAWVRRVKDGDTLFLDDGREVRLIGIDAPESSESEKLGRDSKRRRVKESVILGQGRQSADFLRRIAGGKRVRVEYDVQKKDGYGRHLACLYMEDGTFLNARMVEEGYASVLTVPPNVRHAEHFLALQKRARSAGKGLWGSDEGPVTSYSGTNETEGRNRGEPFNADD